MGAIGKERFVVIFGFYYILIYLSVESRQVPINTTFVHISKVEDAIHKLSRFREPVKQHQEPKKISQAQKTTEKRVENLAQHLEVVNRTVVEKRPVSLPTNSAYTKLSKSDQKILQTFFVEKLSKLSVEKPLNFSANISLLDVTKQPSKKLRNSTENKDLHKVDCSKFLPEVANNTGNDVSNFCYSPSDSLKCYQDPIFCKVYHMSGKRELDWPVYGEYSYLPHKHWVKILQHGGVVFLYHPCANQSSVAQLRNLAEACMHRFALTPYEKLTWEKPLAMVSWGCYLLMKNVNITKSKAWIKSHAFKAPASHVHKNGKFETKLVKAAKVITDIKDTFLCPDEQEKASFATTVSPRLTVNKHDVEELLLKRLAKAKHIKKHRDPKTDVKITVNTRKAFSAFSSLVFLCVLMAMLLLYTKLWKPSAQGKYHRVNDNEASTENSSWMDKVSLLKSSQDFINSFKRKKRGRKMDSLSSVKLLAPINEESDEFEDVY